MLQKLIKFVKDNLTAVLGIAAIVVSLLLMLLPGQFADLRTSSVDLNKMNGYEFFFNTVIRNGEEFHPGTKGVVAGDAYALPAGIIIFVLMALSIASFAFSKKSSALLLLGGVLNVATSVFFFAMEANAVNKYGLRYTTQSYDGTITNIGVIQWVSYVCGALLVLAGAYAIYKAILLLKEEVKRPSVSKGPTYSYLKK